jgi:hypothetical protein
MNAEFHRPDSRPTLAYRLVLFLLLVALFLVALHFTEGRVEYGLLGTVLGLLATVVLFGFLPGSKGSANYQSGNLRARFGGPAALFFAWEIVWLFFVMRASLSDVTVRAHSVDRSEAIVTSGHIQLIIGRFSQSAEFTQRGEAIVPEVPLGFLDRTVRVVIHADGYEDQSQELAVGRDNVLDLSVRKLKHFVQVSGHVHMAWHPSVSDQVIVEIEGRGKSSVADDETFGFTVEGQEGEWVRYIVTVNGRQVYSENSQLRSSVELDIRNSR